MTNSWSNSELNVYANNNVNLHKKLKQILKHDQSDL